jgi:hypothetical protein
MEISSVWQVNPAEGASLPVAWDTPVFRDGSVIEAELCEDIDSFTGAPSSVAGVPLLYHTGSFTEGTAL